MSRTHFKHTKSNRMLQVWFATTLEFNWEFLHMCEICMELRNFSLREYLSDILTCCSCIPESSVGHCVFSWLQTNGHNRNNSEGDMQFLGANTVVSFT